MKPQPPFQTGIYADLDGRAMRSLGIGECLVSRSKIDRLITYSLGSCLAATLYDPMKQVGGIVHCLLPNSSENPCDAQKRPARFVDTGIQLLLDQVLRLGACRNRLVLKLAGAGRISSGSDVFRIGEQNEAAARKVIELLGLQIAAHRLRGQEPLTVSLDIDTGRTILRSPSGNAILNGQRSKRKAS